MAWLPIYATEKDTKWVIDQLCSDPQIAFIIADPSSTQRKRWKAVAELHDHSIQRYCLWHIPSGKLPLHDNKPDSKQYILNPWEGWDEQKAGANANTPYFGAGHPGIIWFDNRSDQQGAKNIGMSTFGWIGNHYKSLGNSASQDTEKWWKSLRNKIKKNSEKIGRENTMPAEIFCLPDALEKINVEGYTRNANPT
ncbi:MAG: hypothetical protein F9K24_18120 [Leptonema illini]|uniref:Uncharacterized protein n=1 Tax=Leptonema illini TaxID=183 RepID=A0A833GYE7_9LEPT|nr:MAG: hypothetical protein F9K24_18120 [Leptonema illini]